jgi:hypothetical protein
MTSNVNSNDTQYVPAVRPNASIAAAIHHAPTVAFRHAPPCTGRDQRARARARSEGVAFRVGFRQRLLGNQVRRCIDRRCP